MIQSIRGYISEGSKVSIRFVDGSEVTFSNIVNIFDGAIEMNNGDNTLNYLINPNTIMYVKPYQAGGVKSIDF